MKFKALLILIVFSRTISAQSSVKDVDGNTYQTFRIDSTEWFLENLKTTRFSNGDSIRTTKTINTPLNTPLNTDTNQIYRWAPAGDKNKIKEQGYLYTWSTVIDKRGICPAGWKVPSNAEWKIAIDKIYNETNSVNVTETDNSNFIYKKKSNSSEIPFFKEVGFAGSRMLTGNYIFQQTFAYYWSNTLDYKGFAWMWYFSTTTVNHYNFEVNGGLSVRCMRSNFD